MTGTKSRRSQRPRKCQKRQTTDRNAPFDEPLGREILEVRVHDVPRRRAMRRKNTLECATANPEKEMFLEQWLGPKNHLELTEVLVVKLGPRATRASEPSQKCTGQQCSAQKPTRRCLRFG